MEGFFAFMSLSILTGCVSAGSVGIISIMWLFNASPETKRPFKNIFKFTALLTIVFVFFMMGYGSNA